MLFKDRRDAGGQLFPSLSKYKGQQEVVVVALVRGGVVTAHEVATRVGVALNLFVVRLS